MGLLQKTKLTLTKTTQLHTTSSTWTIIITPMANQRRTSAIDKEAQEIPTNKGFNRFRHNGQTRTI
jgi:hypothetical protein